MTRSSLPAYVHEYKDRTGKLRRYFRRRGFRRALPTGNLDADFFRAYASALTESEQTPEKASRTHRGDSLDSAIERYLRSVQYTSLAASTRPVYKNVLKNLANIEFSGKRIGERPLHQMRSRHVQALMEAKRDTPDAANRCAKLLRVIWQYEARHDQRYGLDPTIGVQKFRTRSDGFHTWTPGERAKFEARHPAGSKARLVYAILYYTAQRSGDAIRLGWSNVEDGAIVLRQRKTGTDLSIPIAPPLACELEHVPRTQPLWIQTEYERPFTSPGFRNYMRARCDEAGLPHCSAHGLRKAMATDLANAGASTSQIQSVTGHQTTGEIERYTRRKSQSTLASTAFALLNQRDGTEEEGG
ncbi:MAG: tyrosine-type recombinase/integrase [Neomegalonema sp.]|nr:tyrosine-type recombinase/integrase [Neomegalonema sp.]